MLDTREEKERDERIKKGKRKEKIFFETRIGILNFIKRLKNGILENNFDSIISVI